MMPFLIGLLMGLVLAASAAVAHEDITLPELPIPEIDQLFPVYDIDAAFRWADRDTLGLGRWDSGVKWRVPAGPVDSFRWPSRWHVVALSERSFKEVDALLAGIQQPQKNRYLGQNGFCDVDERFGVYLQGIGSSGLNNEFLWTFGQGLSSIHWGNRGTLAHWTTNHLLKNRFSVAGGHWAWDTELRDTGFSMLFRFILIDNAYCAGEHTSHANGGPRHESKAHTERFKVEGPWTESLPIADLLDGNVATSLPAEPEEPAEPAEPEEPTDNAEVERLQAELDALRGDLSELNGDLSAVRDSVAFLLGEPSAGGVDTVEVVRHDTLLFCPQTDEERRDLFDLFTGLDDDEEETEGPAGKAASVKPSSWGAIKALTRRER